MADARGCYSVAQGPVGGLSPVVAPRFNTWPRTVLLINDLAEGRCLLSEFSADTRLGGGASTPESPAALGRTSRMER